MFRFLFTCSVVLATFTAAQAGSPAVVVSNLKGPSAVAVGTDGRVYVSCAGDGTVQVVQDGKATTFARDLGEPRGLAGFGEWLFVADRNRVWRVNRAGKATVFAATDAFPEPPQALQDMDIDEHGNLYVSDPGEGGKGGSIFRIDPRGRVRRVAGATQTPALKSPYGLTMEGESFAVVSDAATGVVHRLNLATGATQPLASEFGGGVAWDKYGRLYLSDPKLGRLAAIPRPGQGLVALADAVPVSGRICVDPTGASVLIPDAKGGALLAVPSTIPGWEVDERPLPIKTTLAFPDLQWAGWKPEDDRGRITALRPIVLPPAGDGSNRVFVATQHGVIHVFPNDLKARATQVFLDLRDKVSYDDNQNEEGFLGLAFHPQYKKNGEFFVFYTLKKPKLTNVICRYRVRPDDPNRADPASEEELLRIQKPFWNHDGGTLCFGPDGYLYIAVGDGGAANDPFNHGQDLTKIFGKVLRIAVDHKADGKPYAVPKDNPFVSKEGARPEIFAYGVRNLWRMAFDRETGVLWASDVGQNLYEEIDLITRGGNYGWRVREALHPFTSKGSGPRADLIDPIWEYHHDVGKSNTGGFVYRGKELPELRGLYLYADYVSNKIWALKYDEAKRRVVANRRIPDPNRPILSFGEDEQGEVYFMTYDNFGRGLYKFERAEGTGTR